MRTVLASAYLQGMSDAADALDKKTGVAAQLLPFHC